MDVPFRADLPTVVYAQRLDQLQVSATTAAHCRKKLLLPKLLAPLVYRYKQKHLEGDRNANLAKQ